MPWSWQEFAKVTPHYKSLPGFADNIQSANNISELPKQAQEFIKLVELEVNTPIAFVSVGQDRTAMLTA